jgi:uncharacterized lipoprotein
LTYLHVFWDELRTKIGDCFYFKIRSSIAGEEEKRSTHKHVVRLEGEGTTSVTSVSESEQQSENSASSDHVLWPLQIQLNRPAGLRKVHL